VRIDYLTGTDARTFPQCFILLQSFERSAPGARFRVCDFGLTGGQRRFLGSRGQLATANPPVPKALDHPWFHKAALGTFVKPDTDAVRLV